MPESPAVSPAEQGIESQQELPPLPPFAVRWFRIADLQKHPRNYKRHPPDQLEHIRASINENGFYKNIVVARDNTILAGHGVVLASEEMGREFVPGYELDLDPFEPAALKILAGDNEIQRLSEVDDRALTEMLKELKDAPGAGLMGTGFDENMLAALLYVTRPASEVQSFNEAAEWVGLPEYEQGSDPVQLVINFRSPADRERFVESINLEIKKRETKTFSTWWPWKEDNDTSSVRFEGTPVSDQENQPAEVPSSE